jgi:hypothetical protein
MRSATRRHFAAEPASLVGQAEEAVVVMTTAGLCRILALWRMVGEAPVVRRTFQQQDQAAISFSFQFQNSLKFTRWWIKSTS